MNEQIIITNVELPFFFGFYDTTLGDYIDCAIEDEIRWIADESGVTHEMEDFEVDFDGYRQRVTELFVKAFNENYMPNWVKEAVNYYLWSPRYYNFQNDEIVAELVLNENWEEELHKFIAENEEKIIALIRKENTSRDGFQSNMPNDFDEWCEWLFVKKDGRAFSQMLRWYLETNENLDWVDFANQLEMDILENLNDRDYFWLKEEKLAQ